MIHICEKKQTWGTPLDVKREPACGATLSPLEVYLNIKVTIPMFISSQDQCPVCALLIHTDRKKFCETVEEWYDFPMKFPMKFWS